MAASSPTRAPGKPDFLAGREDAYRGFLIDPEGLPATPEALLASLRVSEVVWRERAYRGIWLRLPKRLAGSTGAAVEAGFEFHHAEKEYLMLTRWMVEGQPDALPPNASHQVGIGACVVNEHGKILAVRELYGPLRGTGVWKLPTGLVHVGEDITETAEREVLEETGVRASFAGVLGVRQAHDVAFGKSDMFFLVALTPEPGQTVLRPQPEELEDACWMDPAELTEQPHFVKRPLFQSMLRACRDWAEGRPAALHQRKMTSDDEQRRDLILLRSTGGQNGEL